MPIQVTSGTSLQCSFGGSPSALQILPANRVTAGGTPSATIADSVPLLNIAPFGMCSSPTNPVVIAATAAKLGVFTPAGCIPATPAPWIPGAPTVLVGGIPALDTTCMLVCLWGGIIKIAAPAQTTVMVP
jgi:hypothetical protein